MGTVADVMKMVKDNEVKFVDLRFTDTRGKEQHVSVPVSGFGEHKFSDGHYFDGSSIAGWKGIEASDMLLVPDPDTARMDPFTDAPTLLLTCDVIEPSDGKGYGRDPRSILEPVKQITRRRRAVEQIVVHDRRPDQVVGPHRREQALQLQAVDIALGLEMILERVEMAFMDEGRPVAHVGEIDQAADQGRRMDLVGALLGG